MESEMTMRESAKDAANAHTRLNTFYAVIAILEGGCLPGGSESANATASKIIAICKREAGRQLDVYDAAIRSLPADKEGG